MASSTLRTSSNTRLYSGLAWPVGWLHHELMARQEQDRQDARDTLTRVYLDQAQIRAALAHARADTTASEAATTTSGNSSSGAARVAISEWRRSTLEAADSAHHAILERLTASFDSAQQPRISPSERHRILIRLDRINQANESTWIAITSEVNRLADSATAAHGGTP